MADPGSTFGWSIGVLFRAWQDGAAQALDAIPHGPRGFQILATVAQDEPPTQAALAAHLGIDRTVLTYVIDDLVTAGVIERQVDAKDRRIRRLVATDAGRSLVTELDQRVRRSEQHLLAGLSDVEAEQLRTVLHHAAVTVHRNDPGRDACSVVVEALTA